MSQLGLVLTNLYPADCFYMRLPDDDQCAKMMAPIDLATMSCTC